MTEDEKVRLQHQVNGHQFEKTLQDGEGQGSLRCYSPWGHKESEMTEPLNKSNTYNNIFDLSDGKYSIYNAGDPSSMPGSRRFPWRRKWQPTPVFLPGEYHGQRILVGYSSWGHKELDMTKLLTLKKLSSLQNQTQQMESVVFFIPVKTT